LTPELHPKELPCTKPLPEYAFCVCGTAAKGSGETYAI
jgi:hypothetical protein